MYIICGDNTAESSKRLVEFLDEKRLQGLAVHSLEANGLKLEILR